MKKISIIIAVCLSCSYLNAQTVAAGGIDFVKGLSWAQIKKKAKTENRYIFVDVFTTWCVPCIKMDKEVFSQKKVGDFFNKNFINVKVQADKGKNDSDPVKRWYSDAAYIAATYNIDSYFFLIRREKLCIGRQVLRKPINLLQQPQRQRGSTLVKKCGLTQESEIQTPF